jgi:hypothetical protein
MLASIEDCLVKSQDKWYSTYCTRPWYCFLYRSALIDGYIDSENIFLPGFEKSILKDRQSAGDGVKYMLFNNSFNKLWKV